jgi:hypothetical protein
MSCLEEIAEFLARHPTAKIIIVLDTHCLSENGAFIWKGHSAETCLFCRMKEVCVRNIAPFTCFSLLFSLSLALTHILLS